jgi:hypothetical protein
MIDCTLRRKTFKYTVFLLLVLITACSLQESRSDIAEPVAADPEALLGSWNGGYYVSYFADGSHKAVPPPPPLGDTYTFRENGTYTFQTASMMWEGTYEYVEPDTLRLQPNDSEGELQEIQFVLTENELRIVYKNPVPGVVRVEYLYRRTVPPSSEIAPPRGWVLAA